MLKDHNNYRTRILLVYRENNLHYDDNLICSVNMISIQYNAYLIFNYRSSQTSLCEICLDSFVLGI